MSRRGWIIVLIVAGVALAILIGVLGTRNEPSQTKAEALPALCSSLQGFQSSLKTLTGLDPSTATTSELTTDIGNVQTAWGAVKASAQDVQNASMGDLDSAWDNFTNSLKNITSAGSLSDAVTSVTQSAQQLASTAQSTAASVNCSSSSSSS